MSELRASIKSLGIDDPESAISVHALIGGDAGLREQAGELPASMDAVPAWVQSTFLNAEHPFFSLTEHAVTEKLGEEPGEAEDKVLGLISRRPRTIDDLKHLSHLDFDELEPVLERLEKAGLIGTEPNPLEPERPFWLMRDRFARFYHAMLKEHLPRWRRGYITDKLWRMNHAKFDRYVCRPEFARLARDWALDDPAAATTTRVVVPDARHRHMRTVEVAAWDAEGGLIALGTIRWGLRMRERQLRRLRYIRRLLGDPPTRLYCIAPKVEPAIADDPDPDLYRIGPGLLLKGD